MGSKSPRNRRKRKPDNITSIVNLSKYKPTFHEIKLLSRGLKFVPTFRPDSLEIQKDNLMFLRRLKLIHFFREAEDKIRVYEPFRLSSGWTPPGNFPLHLNCYCVNTETEIRKSDSKPTTPNITKNEYHAIKSLKENKDIIIRPADKGGKIVLWGRREYLNEANRQLNNKCHYIPLKKDLTLIIAKEVNEYIEELKNKMIIKNETADYLKCKNPRTPVFYMLPKIHKKDNSGRPIVSQTNGPTEKISQFLDHFLKPIAAKTDSYLKDTSDFLKKLN